MPSHSIDDILKFSTLDLTPYQIRGAKSGINNARTTGPVYVNGSYIPYSSTITGDGTFTTGSKIVTGVSFDAPYDTSSVIDLLKVTDNLSADNTSFAITKINSAASFELDQNAPFTGGFPIQYSLTQREYIVEPDSFNITKTGTAIFTQGSKDVTGVGTSWSTELGGGDFIRQDSSQQFYIINQVIDNTHMELVSPYAGLTQQHAYTAKYWKVGKETIQYTRNGITFDNQGGRWVYDSTTGSDHTTSTQFLSLVDGVDMAFTHSLNSSAPDLMDIATVKDQTFSRSTQYETFQYGLPVVPNPEETLQVAINGILKDRFPNGHQDYVVNYSQNPVYASPPPPALRKVANLMFLKDTSIVTPPVSVTQSGQFIATDSGGIPVAGVMPGSEILSIATVPQVPYRDYILEPTSGTFFAVDSTINEPLVKYVGISYSDQIDYGFSILKNGISQKISFPPQPTDDVLFQVSNGRFKPTTQDHPGPGEIYEIHYMVETTPIQNEGLIGAAGATTLSTRFFPIKQGSILLTEQGSFLNEGEDYFVSYLTGIILLTKPLASANSIVANYTPLSKQVNQMTFEDGQMHCTVLDSRLILQTLANFQFSLLNTALDVGSITILRIYNETRDQEYSLAGITASNGIITLDKNVANITIGLGQSDVVVIDYKFQNESTEYFPIVVNYMNLIGGAKTFYFENRNLVSSIVPGAAVNVQFADSATQYFFIISDSSSDAVGTKISLESTIPEDVSNPNILISDSSVSFMSLPPMLPVTSGVTQVKFPTDIVTYFRPETLIKISSDVYQVSSAQYDSTNTVVLLTSEATTDYTSSSILTGTYVSDIPVYAEGETLLTPFHAAVGLVNQPGFIMNNDSTDVLDVVSDATSLTIGSNQFYYGAYPSLSDLSSAIQVSNISALQLLTYMPDWSSSKIISGQSFSVFKDSSNILNVSDALRYKGVDTTNFSITDGGQIDLSNPLAQYDRYNLDYIGLTYLDESQVQYSLKYFVSLPAKSSVAASFQYNNLDQFYIQVLNERDFLDTVTKPRMQDEANQLNGNIGQGGQVSGDSGGSNTDGGISGDEYRRQDASIECTVFKNVYDFFQTRLLGYGSEMESEFGLRMFNNDGTFSEAQQTAGAKIVSRIFPRSDYTNLEPMKVNPITGYFIDQGAVFTNGSNVVTSHGGTEWLSDFTNGDFFGRTDTTRRYGINTVNSDTSLTLDGTFQEKTTTDPDGNEYTASTIYPIYDDDGYLGPKIIGLKNSNFGLQDGDVFNCTIDGVTGDYTFQDLTPFPFNIFFPLSRLSATDVANQLTASITGLQATVENVIDPATTFGSRSTIVLRTTTPINNLTLGTGAAVAKIMGFNDGGMVIGNRRPTDRVYELGLDTTESIWVAAEISSLNSMLDQTNNRLDRSSYAAAFSTAVNYEYAMTTAEIPIIQTVISATGALSDESSFPTFTDASVAHTNAINFLADTQIAQYYDASVIIYWPNPNYWAIGLADNTQFITFKDSSGVGKFTYAIGDTTIAGQISVILEVPDISDTRFLNGNMGLPSPYNFLTGPSAYFYDGSSVDGTWTGWDYSPYRNGNYSTTNQVTFTITSTNLIRIDKTSSVPSAFYTTNPDNIGFRWIVDSTVHDSTIFYDSSTILDMKNAINSLQTDGTYIFDATGNSIYDYNHVSFQLFTNQSISPTIYLYQGLRDFAAFFYTIDDTLINDRYSLTTDRSSILTNRISYLNTRKTQIYSDLIIEQMLRTNTGDPGDIYIWANNRFNRRQGCYARLNQIQQQIASNQSALNINRLFF